MQGETVQFDLRTMMDGPSFWARMLILYLLALWIAGVVVAVRLWTKLGFNSARCVGNLSRALEKLRTGDRASLSVLGEGFKESTPEAGLRDWASLPISDSMEAYKNVVERAEWAFRFRAEQMAITLGSLRGGIALALGSSALVGLLDSMNLLRHSTSHFMEILTIELEHISASLGATVLIVLQVFAVCWHFSQRLARRRNHWQHFVSRALGE